jgi:HAD superfamily hydrolase (TIGR01549 family)
MEIKGIFFDLYGTLLIYDDLESSWKEWRSAFIDALNPHGVSLDQESVHAIVSEIFEKPMFRRENHLTPYECRLREVISKIGIKLTEAGLSNVARTTVEAWNKHISLDPETVSVLETIRRNKKTALISNFDYPPYIYQILSRHGLDKMFDHITVSGEIGVEKPDPATFMPALVATGVEAAATIYVGDSDVDVEGARRAGMIPVRIVRDRPARHSSEVREIDRLSRILEYLV